MTTPLRIRGLLCTLLFLVFVGVGSAAPLEGLGQLFFSVTVPPGLSAAQVEDVSVQTLAGRGWTIDSKSTDQVVGYLKHRSNEALATLKYDGKKVDIYWVGFEINKKTGERKKPEQPTGWLNYLKNDLTKRLGAASAK